MPDLQEIASWNDCDRAAICGVNHLLVFDFDSEESYVKFWDKKIASEIHNETFTVKTSRGYQNWFFDVSINQSDYKSAIDVRPLLEMEIFVHHHLASVPGNTHSSGFVYELVGTGKILRKDGILKNVIERLRSLGWTGNEFSIKASSASIAGEHIPTEIEIKRLSEILAKKWKPGVRNRLILEICGFLIREGWSEGDALKVFEGIIRITSDSHSRTSVIQKVHYQYRTRDKHALASPNLLREMSV